MVTVAGDISEEHRTEIEKLVASGRFRSISHFIDESIKAFLIDLDNEKKGEPNGKDRTDKDN